jgi:flavin-dependent dehydrogenase
MPTPSYDAIVVGGRLAGAATAMLLARAGRRVLVVERGRYGSETLSTHAFMRAGVIQLSRWGLLDEIVAAGTPAVRRTVVRYGDVDETVDIAPIPHCPALYAPRRSLLDRVLVDAAVRAGAEVRFSSSVTDLLRAPDGRVVGIRGRSRDGVFEAHAPLTIGADGIRSSVARAVGAEDRVRSRHATALVVNWWEGVEADGYQWLYGLGASGGIIPTNDGKVCVWAGAPARAVAGRRPEEVFWDVLGTIGPDWVARLPAGRAEGPYRGFPGVHGYLREASGPGWALVGDAAYFKDPLTAHGMTDALRDAELLARAILATPGEGPELEAALRGYERTRDELSHELFATADRVASFDWDFTDLRELLIGMSAAMRPEIAHLTALDAAPQPVVAA